MATSTTTFTCTTCGDHTLKITTVRRKQGREWRLACNNGHAVALIAVGDEIVITAC